jgi:hypothetical protein
MAMMNFPIRLITTIALAISFLATLVGIIVSVVLYKRKEQERLTLVIFPTLLVLLNVFIILSIWVLAFAVSSIALIASLILSVSYYNQNKPGYMAYTSFFALVSIAAIFFSLTVLI